MQDSSSLCDQASSSCNNPDTGVSRAIVLLIASHVRQRDADGYHYKNLTPVIQTMTMEDCLTTTFNCTSALPECHNAAGFDFITLWNITTRYAFMCPDGPLLFKYTASIAGATLLHLALTNDACEAIAGSSWTKYPGDAIWQRLTTWKFPLFQLLANSPRPPLGFWVESLAFVHFLGDPIGTISDLLCKIDACQGRAIFWQHHLDNGLLPLQRSMTALERQRLWRALAIIVDSFDEWGGEVGDQAQAYLLAELNHLCVVRTTTEDHRRNILQIITKTAKSLAADRSTKSVPVIISQAIFIGATAIAMIRTKSTSNGPNPTTFIQVEIYSIAFTALFFWVIFAVCWTSIIGVSQTAASIPHILEQFCNNFEDISQTQQSCEELAIIIQQNHDQRIYNGGIYSWQPGRKWLLARHSSAFQQSIHSRSSTKKRIVRPKLTTIVLECWPLIQSALPFVVVGSAVATGQLLSALVPPDGWSNRSVAMMLIFAAWLVSYCFIFIPFGRWQRVQFWATFVKDLIAVGVTFGIIMAVQFGIFNKCQSYSRWGRVGVALPPMPAIHEMVRSRLDHVYPAVTAVGIGIQLIVFPGLLFWRYHAAVQVFLQRDDGSRHFNWLPQKEVE